ncbi:5-oxoprolinase (ATP-hydrolyzing) [Thermodesulfatator indicus DSM 15286]|uniref:5-oxoprolinase (ATP-hydrolyzing) n=1 Tax=Thermodesulfatator indicus (strain DSM 15286 / JCM 11887 / CIR29812) TaxID=667014 RepID=F8ABB1_THEID|nr:hydantoinase B/oxoprolinase family protein [Thermodesulfatator indicus]AEH45573.1 5-oxoprolinase (ATP-hydrolyzing) [Thermodesulfatator indicus DSM 15286]
MREEIEITIFNSLLSAIAEEMGIVLQKSSFSANIKERRDFSCAIFDGKGRLIAQAAHIPVHLGAMPHTLAAVRETLTLNPGDVAITNDPYAGGTHLPDITLIKPVYHGEEIAFYLTVRAHHADVGGKAPGSMPLATHIEEEGVLIRPQKLIKTGELNETFFRDFLRKVRNPAEREGDLRAQIAALHRGELRLKELISRYGLSFLKERLAMLLNHSEIYMRTLIQEIPDGSYYFEDFLDDDGLNKEPIPIKVRVNIKGEKAIIDFKGSAHQVATGLNAVYAVTCAAVYYVFFALARGNIPQNQGAFEPLEVITEPETVVDARYPAPVAAGNVETSQRIVDTILGALAQAIPEEIPAASCGSMNNFAFGTEDFSYYETIGGGMGARPGKPGLSGVHTHMTNTLNTPIEALEREFPVLVERYGLRARSGGTGKFRGGDGLIRRFRFLKPLTVTILSERRRLAPYGLYGGKPGRRGQNILEKEGRKRKLPGKVTLKVAPGDVIEIRTPGGGGWG